MDAEMGQKTCLKTSAPPPHQIVTTVTARNDICQQSPSAPREAVKASSRVLIAAVGRAALIMALGSISSGRTMCSPGLTPRNRHGSQRSSIGAGRAGSRGRHPRLGRHGTLCWRWVSDGSLARTQAGRCVSATSRTRSFSAPIPGFILLVGDSTAGSSADTDRPSVEFSEVLEHSSPFSAVTCAERPAGARCSRGSAWRVSPCVLGLRTRGAGQQQVPFAGVARQGGCVGERAGGLFRTSQALQQVAADAR